MGRRLVLAGVFCFIVYTIGASRFPGFSPLRYTALTAGLGWIVIAAATGVATVAGLEPEPSPGDVWSVAPQIAYIALLGAVVAVVAWNAAVGRIGAQNTALFGNLIPITTFTIEIARGYRPVALELAGAGITVTALLATNLLQRRRAQSSSFSTKTSISPPQGRPTAQPSSSEMPYESSWGSPVSSTLRAHLVDVRLDTAAGHGPRHLAGVRDGQLGADRPRSRATGRDDGRDRHLPCLRTASARRRPGSPSCRMSPFDTAQDLGELLEARQVVPG